MKKNAKYLIIAAVCVAVLVAGLLLLIFLPKESDPSAEIDNGTDISVSTDSDGVYQASLNLNDKGELDDNSYGTLLSKKPADIEKINVENGGGTYEIDSYTPTTTATDATTGSETTSTDTTVYTLVGFDDVDLLAGKPDSVANDVAALDFTSVASVDGANASDFGFDSPRATATVTYNDGTKAIVYVGNDAPASAGTYVKFGSSAPVFLVATESVDALMYSVADLVSLEMTKTDESGTSTSPSTVTLSGTNFPDTISFTKNTDTSSSSSYVLTSPTKYFADESNTSKVTGAIRGVAADSAVCVHPSNDQLEEYGLNNPYAQVKADYDDGSIELIASKPDSAGDVFVMVKGGNVVYKKASANLPWVTMTYNDLLSTYVLNPTFGDVTSITVNDGSKDYQFDLATTTSETTDSNGSATTTQSTVVKYGDKELTLANFNVFFQNIAYTERIDDSTTAPSGSPALTVKYTYSSKSDTDTVAFYSTDSTKYIATLNGETIGTVYQSRVKGVLEQISKVIADETVDTLT